MAKAKDRGDEFLKGILAKIPEAEREAVAKHLLTEDILTDIGSAVLRQDDYGRQTAALKASEQSVAKHKESLDKWYEQREKDLAELDERRKRDGNDDDPPKVDLTGYVKREDVEKQMAKIQEDGLWLMKTTNRLSLQHLHDFKEVLNMDDVIKHARDNNLTLDKAYDDFVKPRVDAKRTTETDERIKAAKEEGRAEEARRRDQLPYPVHNSEPTTLDGMDPKFDKTSSVQRAIDDHYKNAAASR